jgi:hypothetical protein
MDTVAIVGIVIGVLGLVVGVVSLILGVLSAWLQPQWLRDWTLFVSFAFTLKNLD